MFHMSYLTFLRNKHKWMDVFFIMPSKGCSPQPEFKKRRNERSKFENVDGGRQGRMPSSQPAVESGTLEVRRPRSQYRSTFP